MASGETASVAVFAPSPPCGGEGGAHRLRWEGEVAFAGFARPAATHLTPTLSPRQRAEREHRHAPVSEASER